ncbi:MAG TPA: hypothetical protein VIB82_01910 [Caulobacteraceae bacterium]|jgi:uncharacterized membrane protein
MAQVLTTMVFALHILGGIVGVGAGLVAVCATKGGRLHRRAGDVFVIAMLVMGIFAAVLGVIRPDQIINVFIAGLTLYLVATAWLTARRGDAVSGAPQRVALAVSLVLWAPFAVLIFQIVTGVTVFKSAFKIEGPILIALLVFAAIITIAVIGDLRVVLNRSISGTPRIARHLWRMCFGLTLALGSAFTNGFARLLPGPYHVPPAFFLPQLLMLGVLLYWAVRVRFPGWAGRATMAPSPS